MNADIASTSHMALVMELDLSIHEDPFFGRVGDAKIASNTVITIEPGAYLRDKGGVRVEDTIVVNSDGYLNLTNLPYELLEL
jgi:Xaa-Pro aminopeptidase